MNGVALWRKLPPAVAADPDPAMIEELAYRDRLARATEAAATCWFDVPGGRPVLTPVELLNRATGQIPAKHFGISKDAFVLDLMLEHFSAVYQLLSGAALTYCMVEDWTAPESSLPRWVQTGVVE